MEYAQTKWDNYYQTINRDFSSIPAPILEEILDPVESSLSKKALDLACGTGELSRELASRQYDVTGLDISAAAIELASKQDALEQVRYTQANLEEDFTTPLDKEFSIIFCKFVYNFIGDRDLLLARIHALLADQGRFVLVNSLKEDKPKIGVDKTQTLDELRQFFDRIDYSFDEESRIAYFICSDKK